MKNELHADYENLILQSLKTTEDVFSDDIHTDKNAEKDAARFFKAAHIRTWADQKVMLHCIFASPTEYLKKIDAAY